jgi:hypothetical protein
MARAPLLLDWWAVDPGPGADDSGKNQDHAGEYDEMSRVLAQGESGDAPLVDVGNELVLNEIEQEAERHDGDPEPGKPRKGRSGPERRDRDWLDQSAYLRLRL